MNLIYLLKRQKCSRSDSVVVNIVLYESLSSMLDVVSCNISSKEISIQSVKRHRSIIFWKNDKLYVYFSHKLSHWDNLCDS